MKKYCPGCKRSKLADNFHRNRCRKDGYQNHCKKCMHDKWGKNLVCLKCGVSFYIRHRNVARRKTQLCPPCAGAGARQKIIISNKSRATYITYNKKGYRFILKPGDTKYRLEHRVIMENHIKRPLGKTEVVHHIDNDIKNNTIGNLWLTNVGDHKRAHNSILKAAWSAFKEGVIVFNGFTGIYEFKKEFKCKK